MTTQSLGGAVLSSFFATWSAAADGGILTTNYGDKIRVYDGPPITDRAAPIEVWVGSVGEDGEDEEIVIRGTQVQDTFESTGSRTETIDITNTIWVADGSTVIGTARTAAFSVMNDVVTLVRDSGLGVGTLFRITEAMNWELRQGQYPTGVGVKLTFTMRCEGLV